MMKKFLSVALAAAMAVLMFASCVGTTNPQNGASDGNQSQSAYSSMKIGVIHIGDPADGSGYSYAHDQGIQAMKKELGLNDDQIVSKLNISDTDTTAIKNSIEDCIVQGCTMIFGTSYGYMDTMDELAKEYPDVLFSHGTGFKSNDTNFNNYFGRIYQARYLAGIAAGLKTKSNKIGYVSAYGTELAETCSGINAFALGAQSVNPDAVVYVKKLNSWYDPTNETAYAESLLNIGCDVIGQHCDTANPQIAAQKAGAFGCGYNSDMTKDAPKGHLTAPVWNWGVYYTAAVKAAAEGKWKEFGNYYAGVKEGLVDISPLSNNCVKGTQEKIDAVKKLFKNDDWDVFSGVKLSFDENKVVKNDAELVSNKGKTIVKKGGKSVKDSIITGSMNYYVKGVEEK